MKSIRQNLCDVLGGGTFNYFKPVHLTTPSTSLFSNDISGGIFKSMSVLKSFIPG